MRAQTWLAVLALALPIGLPSVARAQTSGGAAAADADEEAREGTARSDARDMRTNHVLVHGDVGAAFPLGSLSGELPFSEQAGTGLTLGGGIGLGLSRYMVLDIGATFGMLSTPEGCTDCSAQSFDVGLGLTYHLAQGLAIDPWISFGVGYRRAMFTDGRAQEQKTLIEGTFEGLDVARIGLGGEFFPVPWAGIGPYFQVAVGSTIAQPQPELTSGIYTVFHMGVRIAFDPVGRRPPAPAVAKAQPGAGATGQAPRTESEARSKGRATSERGLSWGSF